MLEDDSKIIRVICLNWFYSLQSFFYILFKLNLKFSHDQISKFNVLLIVLFMFPICQDLNVATNWINFLGSYWSTFRRDSTKQIDNWVVLNYLVHMGLSFAKRK